MSASSSADIHGLPKPAAGAVIETVSHTASLRNAADHYGRYALAGAVCAAGTHSILVPLDVIKTNVQLSNGKDVATVLRDILMRSGPKGLLTGAIPTLLGYSLQGAFKFGAYEALNDRVGAGKKGELAQIGVHMATAGVAELIASTALCPFEAARIRLVAGGAGTSLIRTVQDLHRTRAFYRGWLPLVLKQVPYTTVQLAVFSASTHSVYTHVLPALKMEDPKPATQVRGAVMRR